MRITLLGAGHIGQTITRLLHGSGDYAVTVVDRSAAALARISADPGCAGVATRRADTADVDGVRAVLSGQDAVVNALPYHLATTAATAARQAGVHYFEVTRAGLSDGSAQ
jgi:saccharopine dehydrogenase-like NADP-dependent oxidoreductase